MFPKVKNPSDFTKQNISFRHHKNHLIFLHQKSLVCITIFNTVAWFSDDRRYKIIRISNGSFSAIAHSIPISNPMKTNEWLAHYFRYDNGLWLISSSSIIGYKDEVSFKSFLDTSFSRYISMYMRMYAYRVQANVEENRIPISLLPSLRPPAKANFIQSNRYIRREMLLSAMLN